MRRAEGPPYRILAIDDDPAALEILKVTAESEGFAFRGFGNQRAGLAALSDYVSFTYYLDTRRFVLNPNDPTRAMRFMGVRRDGDRVGSRS